MNADPRPSEQFLVRLVHTQDELPLAIFDNHCQASTFAAGVTGFPTQEIREIFNSDCSTPVCVDITRFEHGRPVFCEVVKVFGDVDDDLPRPKRPLAAGKKLKVFTDQ
jgi:hypothetical protein